MIWSPLNSGVLVPEMDRKRFKTVQIIENINLEEFA